MPPARKRPSSPSISLSARLRASGQQPVPRWNTRLRNAKDTKALRIACDALDTLPPLAIELLGRHPLLTGEIEEYFLQRIVDQQRPADPETAQYLPFNMWTALYSPPERFPARVARIWPDINLGWRKALLENRTCLPECAEAVIQQMVARGEIHDQWPTGADHETQGAITKQNNVRAALLRLALSFPGVNPALLEMSASQTSWKNWVPVFLLTCPASTIDQRRRWLRRLRKEWKEDLQPGALNGESLYRGALASISKAGGMNHKLSSEPACALDPGTLIRLLDGCPPDILDGRLSQSSIVTRRLYARNILSHWKTHSIQLASVRDSPNRDERAWTENIEMLLDDPLATQRETDQLINAVMPHLPLSVLRTLRRWVQGQRTPMAETPLLISSWLREALVHPEKTVRLDAIRLLGEVRDAARSSTHAGDDHPATANEEQTEEIPLLHPTGRAPAPAVRSRGQR